jgi:hypothetical protein
VSSIAAVMLDLTVQFLGGERQFHFTGLGSILIGATILNVLLVAAIYRPLCIGRHRKLVRRARLSLS